MSDIEFQVGEDVTIYVEQYASNELLGDFRLYDETSIAIASGVLAVPAGSSVIIVQAETGTTDTLTDITTKVGLIFLRADTGDTITITDNGSDAANKIRTRTGGDVILSETAYTSFYRKTTTQVWRSVGQTYTAGSGLILTGNEFSVNPDLVLTSVEADDVTVHDSATFDFISGNRIPYGSFFNTNANFHFTSLVLHTPNLTVNNQLEIQGTTISMKSVGGIRGRQRFYETDTNGLNYVELIAPDSLSQTFELILPADVPSAGQVLAVASWSNPVITTEWITVGSGTVNSGLSGRLTYYPSNGTTVDDASDLSYDSGTSTLTVNGIVAIGSSGQIEDDGGGNLQITSNDILKIIGSTRTEVTGRIDVYDGLRSMGGDTGTRTILETNDSGQDAVHLYRYSTTQTSQFHYYDDDNLYSIALRAQATFPTSSSRVIELPANTGSVNDVLKISAINGNVYTTEWSAGGGGGMAIGGSISGSPANNAFLYADSSDTLQAASSVLFDQTGAILQLDSTTKGFLPPRHTGAQRLAVASPPSGLQDHDTSIGLPHFFNGDHWAAKEIWPGFSHQTITVTPNRSSGYVSNWGLITTVGGGGGAAEHSEQYGTATKHTTSASAGTEAGCIANVSWFYRGSTNGENGFLISGGFILPDASYDESGASTGSRIFVGLTNIGSVAAAVNVDNPIGARIGFSRIHVNGSLTNTNWYVSERDSTTETRTDTGLSFSAQAVYRYWIKCNPQGTEITLQIAKNVSGTTTFSNVITANTNIPPTTQALKPVTALYTINAVARTIGSSTFHAAIPFKGFAS